MIEAMVLGRQILRILCSGWRDAEFCSWERKEVKVERGEKTGGAGVT
jgi:hypothetical protein